MPDLTTAEALIFQAIDQINAVLMDENAVPKEADTVLLGHGAVLDSMGFVNFIVALEELLALQTGQAISLTEALNARDSGMSDTITIADLASFLSKLKQR